MNDAPLALADLADLADLGLDRQTPVWFYVLREADVHTAGQHLGPIGAGSSPK